jgi:transketolase
MMAAMKNLREAYGTALVAAGRKNRDVVALEADLGKSTRSVLFQAEFPDRFFEMGIAEQNMASTAAGLALRGKIPFIHSFAVFAAGRACPT